MATQLMFYPIPYRDTARREAVITSAANDVANTYQQKLVTDSFTVRPLFFNDLVQAGANSSGTTVVTPTGINLTYVGSTPFGYPASANIAITTPSNKVFGIYGFADHSASPVARLVTVTISGTTYNPIYLAPAILTDEDKIMVLNGKFRPIPPNTTASITVYGVAPTSTGTLTEAFEILGFVAETPPSISQ